MSAPFAALEDTHMERALLGAILNWPDQAHVLVGQCAPDAFTDPRNADIARAIASLHNRLAEGAAIDLASVWHELVTMKRANTVTMDYLGVLTGAGSSSAWADAHAQTLADLAQRRKLARELDRIRTLVLSGEGQHVEVMASAVSGVLAATERHDRSEPRRLDELAEAELRRIERGPAADTRARYRTGLAALDALLSPMEGGQLLLIGGRPSAGKTSLVMHLARSIAASRGVVLVFSLETTGDRLARRQLASLTSLSLPSIAGSAIDAEGVSELYDAVNALSGLPVWIDDGYGLTLSGLRAKGLRHKAQHGLGAIVIDYLQLLRPEAGMGGGRAGSREQEVAAISRGLKALAKELDVPVLALSQLNRESEKRDGKRPTLADLRDSGQLEQDADAVLLAYALNDERTRIGIALGKQKDGPIGEAVVGFDPTRTAFRDLTEAERAAMPSPDAAPARASRLRSRGYRNGLRVVRGSYESDHANDTEPHDDFA